MKSEKLLIFTMMCMSIMLFPVMTGAAPTLLDNYDGVGDLTYTEEDDPQWNITGGLFEATTNGTSDPDHSYASYDLSSSISGWNLSTANENEWIGWMDIGRTPSGWGTSNYGMGYVLAANDADLNDAGTSGYALVIANNDDNLTLIKFSAGINGGSSLPSNSTAILDTGHEYVISSNGLNVYVKLESDGNWTVKWEPGTALSDADAVDPANYTNSATTSSPDTTYSGSSYSHAGWLWSHSSSGSSSSEAYFDNFGAGALTGVPTPEPTPEQSPTPIPTPSISDIQYTTDPSGDSDYNGMTVEFTGVVTAYNASDEEVFVQDGAGAWNGIMIWDTGALFSGNIGDAVTIQGEVNEDYDCTRVFPDSITVTGTGTVPATTLITTGEASLEQYECVLVRVETVTVTAEPNGFGEWEVSDGSGDMTVDDEYYDYDPTLNDTLDFVQGPLYYAYGDFKILPRDINDIGLESTPVPSATPGTPPDIIINEVWYNDPGTDTYGFVEIYGAPGTSLDFCKLQEFNDDCIINISDVELDLSGEVIPANGYFVVGFVGTTNVDLADDDFMDNVQNGPCDGVRLLYYTTEIDAVQYGTDCDPSCGEGTSAPEPPIYEQSLGRYPDASDTDDNFTDFTNMYPSPGEANDASPTGVPTVTPSATPEGDTPTPTITPTIPAAPSIIINEVDCDQAGPSDGFEFIELYDGGTGNTSLDGVIVVLFTGSSDTSYDVIDLNGYATDVDGYFTIGSLGMGTDIEKDPGSMGWLQNGADGIGVYSGYAGQFPFGTAVTATNLIDGLVYGTSDPDATGLLAVLVNPGELQVDENINFDKDIESMQRCPNGTGGAMNTSTYEMHLPSMGIANPCVGVTPTAGTPLPSVTPTNTPAPCGNNILNNAGFETWTAGPSGPPDNWYLGTGNCTASQTTAQVFEGTYACTVGWDSASTQQFNAARVGVVEGETYDIRLRVYDNDVNGRVRIWGYWLDIGNNILDNFESPYSVDYAGWQTISVIGGPLTAPAGAVALDYQIRLYDESGWTGSATAIVDLAEVCGVAGTLPTATPTGPSPTPSETPTAAPSISIYDIQSDVDVNGESNLVSQIWRTRGVVTAMSTYEVWVQDGAGAWNGIVAYKPDATVSVGDDVIVQGMVAEYQFGFGEYFTEISPCDILMKLADGTLPPASVVATNDINQEQWESVLVRAETVTVTNEDLGYGEWEIDDGSGAVVVDDWFDYDYVPVLDDVLDYVQGPVMSAYGTFRIAPRDNYDISATAFPTPTSIPTSIPTTGPVGLGLLLAALSSLLGISAIRRRK